METQFKASWKYEDISVEGKFEICTIDPELYKNNPSFVIYIDYFIWPPAFKSMKPPSTNHT